jgi:hypothetical protein
MRLDDNYSIDTKGAGTVLNFQQQRQREKNKVMVDFIHKDSWFFLSLPQALNKYLDLKLEGSEDVKDCLNKIEEVRQIIKQIK